MSLLRRFQHEVVVSHVTSGHRQLVLYAAVCSVSCCLLFVVLQRNYFGTLWIFVHCLRSKILFLFKKCNNNLTLQIVFHRMKQLLNVSSRQYASVPQVNDPELGSEVPTDHKYLPSVHNLETRLSPYVVDIVTYIGKKFS